MRRTGSHPTAPLRLPDHVASDPNPQSLLFESPGVSCQLRLSVFEEFVSLVFP